MFIISIEEIFCGVVRTKNIVKIERLNYMKFFVRGNRVFKVK